MPPQKRTLRSILAELVEDPFFPILFISEFIKQLVTLGVLLLALEGEILFAAVLALAFGILSLLSILIWVLSDAINLQEDVIGTDGGDGG